MNLLQFVISFVTMFGVSLSGNILFLNGIASPSHHLWNRVLIEGLVAKGHNVTMASVDNFKNPEPNIHYIFMEAVYDTVYGGEGAKDLFEMAEETPLQAIPSVYEWCDLCCDGIINSKGLDIILNYPDNFKFDVVVYDFTCGACMLPLLHKFNYPPLVAVTAFGHPPYSHHLTGGQKHPSLVPHYVTNVPQVMNYQQRLFNHLLYAVDTYYRQYVSIPNMEKKLRERMNIGNFPSLDELERKTVLMLLNTENAVDYEEPLQPNVIQIGGLQIQKPKPLPKEMLEFVESNPRGTILMSFGTNMKANMLGDSRLTNIIKTFEAIPEYNFIWKFESEPHELPRKLPKNVFVSKFLPQNDILAHPNIKAFITHSGGLGTQESLWYGKPMIAVPFFVDQIRTADKSVRMGVAVKVDFREMRVDDLKSAILTILENPSYAKKSAELSKVFQDKPQPPLDVAVWWIEYVMRNPTSPAFKSTTKEIGWFAASSYDVMLTVLFLVPALGYAIFKILKVLRSLVSKSESKKLKRH